VNIAVYLRVSTRRQAEEGASIDTQRVEIGRWVTERYAGAEIVEYRDDGYSGESLNRPALERLLGSLDEIAAVVVWRFDRWSRDPVDRRILAEQLGDTPLHSVTQTFDDSPEGELMADLDASLAAYESRKIGLRTRMVLRAKAERGDIVTAPPFGYRSEPREPGQPVRWVIVPDQAEVISTIDAMYLDGRGGPTIARYLNDRRVRAPGGGTWSPGGVRTVLARSVYAARQEYGRERWRKGRRVGTGDVIVTDVAVPQIRDDETQRRIAAERERRSIDPGRARTRSLFAGVLRCGVCGGKMQVDSDGDGYRAYVCTTHKRDGTCTWNRISERRLLRAVLEDVKELANVGYDVEVTVEAIDEEQVRREIDALEIRRGRLLEGYESGVLALDDVAPRLERLSERRDALELRMKESGETYTVPLARIVELASIGDDRDAIRLWVRDVVKAITWNRDTRGLSIDFA
jgi:site-specific DNA recombinase